MDIRDRKRVREMVTGCRGCSLVKVARRPVPFSAPLGPLQWGIVVVGEAPGRVEDEAGKPLCGPSGELVRTWLREHGVNDLDVGYMNVVCCFPNRTPNGMEVTACRTNLTAQLDLLSPSYVLVLGGVALNALCPQKTRISEAHGYWWKLKWNDSGTTFAWAMATWHPAAVLRNKGLEKDALDEVDYFVRIAREEMEPLQHVWCLKCKDSVVEVVTDCGLGYCARCYTLVS